jgi:hypothetical protein
MQLELQTRDQQDRSLIHTPFAPLSLGTSGGDDYWAYRVVLTERQAVIGFPVHGTIGIGFASGETGVHLPYRAMTDQIMRHIGKYKGDPEIPDEAVRAAIVLIQLRATMDHHAVRAQKYTELERAHDGTVTVPGAAYAAMSTMFWHAQREVAMLQAELERRVLAEHVPPPAPLVLPAGADWCTTWSGSRRHVSMDLTPARKRPASYSRGESIRGRTGRSLCGASGAMDAERAEQELDMFGSRPPKKPFNIMSLKACTLCVRAVKAMEPK